MGPGRTTDRDAAVPDDEPAGREAAGRHEVGIRVADDRQALLTEVARLQGVLEATREQLAAAEAVAQQLRTEVAAAREEGAAASRELAQVQRHAEDRLRTAERRADELRHDLEEERRRCLAAEEERAVLIASLGRRGRRRVGSAPG